MLVIDSASVYYGRTQALRDVSLRVERGELVTLIGGNGAGKTTLLMTISGVLRPRSGRIHFNNVRIDVLESDRIVRLGLVQVAQGRQIFPEMTVEENLVLGAFTLRSREVQRGLQKVYGYFPVLYERRVQSSGTLSGGEQQMVAIGRALMASPRLLLMDEPSSGLAPKTVDHLAEVVRTLRRQEQLTILLVEQNASMALELSDRGYVLENGAIVAQGSAAQLSADPIVMRAYLGV